MADSKELEILLQVITRYTEQMVTVAENLKHVAELQEKTNARLYNGLSREIQQGVIDSIKACNGNCQEQHKCLTTKMETVDNTTKETNVTLRNILKLASVIALVVAISFVVIKGIYYIEQNGHSALTHIEQSR